jgi:hypothetical protein
MKQIHLLLILAMVTSLNLNAQNSQRMNSFMKKGPLGILFQENFNGATVLPTGWTEYTADGWDMILPQNDEVIFFKQSTGVNLMILSTPLIDLTNASQLTFRFRSNALTTSLKVGLMSDPMNPATFTMLTQFNIDTAMTLYTVPIGSVTGSTHIAFNWIGSYFKAGYLDDVIVYDDAVQNNVPSNVTNVLLTPDPAGANAATLSWTNPALQADGDPLTDLDSVVIAINGIYHKTILNPPIGGNQNTSIVVPLPGLYTATLTPYNSDGAGVSNTSQEIWIGLDMPAMPDPVILTQQGNLATLKWGHPTTGMHGGYFNGLISNYTIIRADNWQTTVAGSDTTITMNVTDPGTFNYQVIPENLTGSGPAGISNTGVFLTGNYLLWEDFWVSVPAHLWSIQGESFYNWWLSNGNLAGGTTPEMEFHSTSPYFNSFSRMSSPTLNTTGISALTLEFRHQHTAYAAYLLNIETSSDGGVTWHTAFSIPVSQTTPAETRQLVLTNEDVGTADFRFAFTFSGNEENVESLVIDEVRLSPTAGMDMAANSIVLPAIIHPADQVVPRAVVQNLGVEGTTYKAIFRISGATGNVYTDSLTSTIQQGGIDTVNFAPVAIPEGEFRASLTIHCAPDGNPVNDTVSAPFVVYQTYSRDLAILEDATGTWCTYCPGAAMGIRDLIDHGYKIAAIAYHGGDVYETPVSRSRINYYPAITGFPTMMFDGLQSHVGGYHSISMYETYKPIVEYRMSVPSPLKIAITGCGFSNFTLNATITLASLSPINNSNLVLHAALTESNIAEAWQGQTELDDVMRLMYADSVGIPVNLSDRTESVNVAMTANPSWIRENMQLVVFVQDKVTREIFNGAMEHPVIFGIGESNPIIKIYPNPASDWIIFPDFRDATIEIYSMTGMMMKSVHGISGPYRMDIRDIESGSYVVKVKEDGWELVGKVIVGRLD